MSEGGSAQPSPLAIIKLTQQGAKEGKKEGRKKEPEEGGKETLDSLVPKLKIQYFPPTKWLLFTTLPIFISAQ